MASPQGSDKFLAEHKIEMWDHDPAVNTAILVSPDGGTTVRSIDMKDYGVFVCAAMSSTLNGNGINKLEIVAADDAALSTNLVVIKDSGAVVADAVGDWVVEVCTAEEIAQESADNGSSTLRYVGGRITCADAADEAVVTYIASKPRFPRDGLTADATIA